MCSAYAMKSLANDLVSSIQVLVSQGKSTRQIQLELGVGKSTVARYIKALNLSIEVKKGGQKSKVSERLQRRIKNDLIQGNLKSAKDVNHFLLQENISITYSATCKLLHKMGFRSKKKVKKPFLKACHKKARLKWANFYKGWTVDDWKYVVWSDETKINIWGSDGVTYCWTRPGDPIMPHHLDLTVKHGGGSLMLWGCISSKGAGNIHQIQGKMDADMYCKILDEQVDNSFELWNFDKEETLYQQDNDPKHTSKLAQKWFIDNHVNLLPWPSQSPDLNPIEHVWHQLKLRLSLYPTRATSIRELWNRCEVEWAKFTPELCQRYISSMPARVQAVIEAKGGHTKY